MPHLTLEYTDSLKLEGNFPELFKQLHQVLVDLAGIQPGNCKSRAVRLTEYFVGRGKGRQAFLHLQVRFLEGRSPDLKRKVGDALLQELRTACPEEIQVTVEILDIEKDVYFKYPDLPSPS